MTNRTEAQMRRIKEAQQAIEVARARVVLLSPFIGSLLLNIPAIVNPDMVFPPGLKKTARVDGRVMEFDPDFVLELTKPELVFVIAHETLHPMFQHNFRRNSRDPLLWNVAADIVINYTLIEEGIGTPPKDLVHMPEVYTKCGGITERIYDYLMEEGRNFQNTGPGTGAAGPLDQCVDYDPNSTPDDGGQTQDGMSSEQTAQEWKLRAAQAAQAAKMHGKLSAGFSRLVGEIINPRVDWRSVLERFIVRAKISDRSYARLNRRLQYPQYILPTISGEQMGEIVVAVDCSGSITGPVLNQFAAEIKRLCSDTHPLRVHIVYFDSSVCHYDAYDQGEPVELHPHGGGGTAFSPVFRFVEDKQIEPVACVFLTDLYCSDFGYPQDYPVLWVSNGADKAPWGEVVVM